MLAFAVAGCILAAGCGGGNDGAGAAGTSDGASKPTALRVGTVPIVDVAPLYVGMQNGFFKSRGLTITPVPAQGGAAVIAALVAGDLQFGFGNETSLAIAASKGLPVCIVAEGNRAGTDPDRSYTQLLVREDSGIRDLRDLEGKTIAINSLNNVGPLSINTAVAEHGGDISKLHYIEIPFPEMNLALKGRRVDAIWQTEPFLTQARSQLKVRNVSSTLIDTKPDYTVSAYFTSRKYAQQNPDMVRRFVEGMNQSLTYSQAHPDEVRSLVPTYTKIPANAAKRILLSHWTPDIGKDSLALTIKLAKRYGYLEKPPSVDEMLCPSR